MACHASLFVGLALTLASPAIAAPETLFAVTCPDSPAGHAQRAVLRPAHLAYLEAIRDRIAIGGGIIDSPGAPASGSFIVYRAESLDDAKALLAHDPLSKGGVFGECRWTPFAAVVGTWLPH